ncbi:MAG: tyrosine-type recombinase/integrase [Fimbriimonas sp.]
MNTELVPVETEILAPAGEGALVPGDLSTAQGVHDYLGRLLIATRGEGKGTLAGALVPWVCDRLPSENSRKAYGRDLRDFVTHMRLHGIDPTEATGDDVRMYKEALRQAGQKSATIARKLSVIRGTYEQWGKKGFVDWHVVQDIQAAESPRVEKNATPGLTQNEATELLKVAREAAISAKRESDRLLAIRDYALLFVFFRTACRVTAISGACVGHVERSDTDWYLRVTEKGNKRSRKILLEAAPAVIAYIEAAGIGEDREGPLFRPLAKDRKGFQRKHLDRKDVLDVVKKWGRLAGIQVDRLDGRGVGVHSLRKTTITNALNNGAPMHQVQELAGHADIRTTQGYYMKRESDAEDAARHIQIR